MSHVASPSRKLNESKTSKPALARRLEFDKLDVFELMSSKQTKRDLWEWQYERNPAFVSAEYTSVALYRDEALVGFCGIMPVGVKFDDSHYTARWCCDLHVNNQFRRQGIAGELYKHIESESDVAMGFGTGDVAYSLKLKRGWQTSENIEEHFFTNKAQSFKGLVKRALQFTNKNIKRITQAGTPALTQHCIDIQKQISIQEFNDLWAEVEGGYQRTVVRDGAYVNWKYVQHPANNYNIISLRTSDRALLGALVVRKTSSMAHIVDYIGPASNLSYKQALLNYFLRWSKDSDKLHCISSCPEWNQLLKFSGFLKYPKTPRFTVTTSWSKEPLIARDWFLMTGDSDGDLLNATNHEK